MYLHEINLLLFREKKTTGSTCQTGYILRNQHVTDNKKGKEDVWMKTSMNI